MQETGSMCETEPYLEEEEMAGLEGSPETKRLIIKITDLEGEELQ